MTSSSAQTDGSTEKPTKHVVADELAENPGAVAKVTLRLSGDTVEQHYVGLEDGYAEVLEGSRRATHIKRHRLCAMVEGLSEDADIEVTHKALLDEEVKAHVESAVETLREDIEAGNTRTEPTTDTTSRRGNQPAEGKYPDEVTDDISRGAQGPIDSSEVHGGGWS